MEVSSVALASPLVEVLAGKVAVVTGGGSGIGAAMAKALAGQGMSVVVADISAERAGAVADAIGAAATAAAVDVASAPEVEAFAARVWEEYGGCHVLCNNAGVAPIGRAWEQSAEEWQWTFGLNVFGVANGCRAFVPRMLAQNGPERGHIVNTASLSGLRLVPEQGLYAATKHAVVGYSETLRAELAPLGIGVTVLCPGTVPTNIQVRGMAGAERSEDELGRAIGGLMGAVDTAYLTAVDADRVAALTVEAIRNDDAYAITAPGAWIGVDERFARLRSAFETTRERHPDLP